MPRLSISRAMAVVAIVAANCAALRAVLPEHGGLDLYQVFLVGLLPLFNAQIIGVYLISTRYRISLRRRMAQEAVGFAPAFAIANALALDCRDHHLCHGPGNSDGLPGICPGAGRSFLSVVGISAGRLRQPILSLRRGAVTVRNRLVRACARARRVGQLGVEEVSACHRMPAPSGDAGNPVRRRSGRDTVGCQRLLRRKRTMRRLSIRSLMTRFSRRSGRLTCSTTFTGS